MILTTDTTYAAQHPHRDTWYTVITEDAVFPLKEGEYIVAGRIEEASPSGRRHVVVHIIDGDAVVVRFCINRKQAVDFALGRYSTQGG